MDRSEILAAIGRTAVANEGRPLGHRAFEQQTGIRQADWLGKYWRSWGEAVREAGFTPNALTGKIDEAHLLRSYCLLTRELGHFPAKADFRLKKKDDPTFPAVTVFTRRFGSFPGARARAHSYTLAHPEFADLSSVLEDKRPLGSGDTSVDVERPVTGYVYMIRHGSRQEYKIGRTHNRLRREGEIRLQLPEQLEPVHYIETDDPVGVEAYWHARFASKRKEGEWFALSRDDVAAFKKWKRIA